MPCTKKVKTTTPNVSIYCGDIYYDPEDEFTEPDPEPQPEVKVIPPKKCHKVKKCNAETSPIVIFKDTATQPDPPPPEIEPQPSPKIEPQPSPEIVPQPEPEPMIEPPPQIQEVVPSEEKSLDCTMGCPTCFSSDLDEGINECEEPKSAFISAVASLEAQARAKEISSSLEEFCTNPPTNTDMFRKNLLTIKKIALQLLEIAENPNSTMDDSKLLDDLQKTLDKLKPNEPTIVLPVIIHMNSEAQRVQELEETVMTNNSNIERLHAGHASLISFDSEVGSTDEESISYDFTVAEKPLTNSSPKVSPSPSVRHISGTNLVAHDPINIADNMRRNRNHIDGMCPSASNPDHKSDSECIVCPFTGETNCQCLLRLPSFLCKECKQ